METIIYLALSVLLVGAAHVWSAIKSGCFYSAMSRPAENWIKPKLLEKYIENLHYVQTPFWYSLFGAFGVMLFAMFRIMNPATTLLVIALNMLSAYLITAGTSAMAGPLYQGFVNVGCGLPFIDPNERREMELANPFTGKKRWVKRFWYGKRRVYLAFVGLAAVAAGIALAWMI